jgi:Bacterial regulatory helix-turn-helix protein, lysR family
MNLGGCPSLGRTSDWSEFSAIGSLHNHPLFRGSLPSGSGIVGPVENGLKAGQAIGWRTGHVKREQKIRGTQFSELSVFIAVAEQASFTKAAKRLGRSTATLIQLSGTWRSSLASGCLNRTTRKVALTAGEQLEQLRPLLEAFDDAVEPIKRFATSPPIIFDF